MARFRSNAVEFDAQQWDGKVATSMRLARWSEGRCETRVLGRTPDHRALIVGMFVKTALGLVQVEENGWIVRDPEGQFTVLSDHVIKRFCYPIDPDTGNELEAETVAQMATRTAREGRINDPEDAQTHTMRERCETYAKRLAE